MGVAAFLRPSTSANLPSSASALFHGKAASTYSTRAIKSARDMAGVVECHLLVLGTGGNELAPSLCLFTETKRYIFNCGENFQRLTTERRIRTLRQPRIFTTGVSWRNLGGLIGYSMFTRDSKKFAKLDLYGPQNVVKFAEVGHYLIRKEKFEIATVWKDEEPLKNNIYRDENLTITMVELQLTQTGDERTSSSDEDLYDEEEIEPAAKRKKQCVSNTTAAFVCKLVDIRGKFDPQKAKSLGLPPGPLYRSLTRGESVVAPNGKTIHPSDVLGPVRKGPVFVVLECPNEGYIPSITGSAMLAKETFRNSDQEVALIVHMSPIEVLQNDEYCKWMASFGDSTKHLILNEDLCPKEVGLTTKTIEVLLHMLDQSMYHLPSIPEVEDHRSKLAKLNQMLPRESIIIGQTYLKYHLKPTHKIGVDKSDILKPFTEELDERIVEIQSNPTLLKAILPERGNHTTDNVVSDSKPSSEPGDSQLAKLPPLCMQHSLPKLDYDDALVTFLGTASAVPSKLRNVSGILVQTSTNGNILLDCGEGSLSQIYRCFGQQLGDEIILNLNGVFLSHIHADHHLGLVSVLQKKEELLKQKGADAIALKEGRVTIIMPWHNKRWLSAYSKYCERTFFNSIDCQTLVDQTSGKNLSPYLSDLNFRTVKVIHCSEAYGVVIRHLSGWSIVYSGDTRPCGDLVNAGKEATLLIHEATFEDELVELAKESNHCTVGEALKISAEMNPGFTILTHFSQRYDKVPSLVKGQLHSKVGVAFDCMSVQLKELHKLDLYSHALKEILAEVSDTDDSDFVLPASVDFGDM